MTNAVSIFLQAGVPGITPYGSGSHVWGKWLAPFEKSRRVIVLDLPGVGKGDAVDGVPTINVMADFLVDYIKTKELGEVHLLGHDVAGLVVLHVAIEHPELVSCISIVSSPWAAPSGDSIENYTLRHPPQPLWGRQAQFWTFDRLSYSHQHIDDELIDAAVAATQGAAHRAAVGAMTGDGYTRTFMTSVTKAKFRFFQLARGDGLAVPLQVIHGASDPMLTPDYPLALFKVASRKLRQAQFHLISRCGVFPFREQPDEFYRLVSAFVNGLTV